MRASDSTTPTTVSPTPTTVTVMKSTVKPATEVFDAKHFCGQLALMICESRCTETALHTTPILPYGSNRKMGGTLNAEQEHVCSPDVEQCQRAIETRRTVNRTLVDKVPITISIFLINPDCSQISPLPHAILMEKWTIVVQTIRRRSMNGASTSPLSPQFLLQAVKSNLAFSQVSAHLSTSMDGWTTIHRCSLPGQDVGGEFEFDAVARRSTTTHQFPECKLSKHHVLRVSVECKNRADVIAQNGCTKCTASTDLSRISTSSVGLTSYENPLFQQNSTSNTLKERLEAICIEQQRNTTTPEPQDFGGSLNTGIDFDTTAPTFADDALSLLSTPGGDCDDDDYGSFESPAQTAEDTTMYSPTGSGPTKCKRQRRQQTILYSDASAETQLLSPDKLGAGVHLSGCDSGIASHTDQFLTATGSTLFEQAIVEQQHRMDEIELPSTSRTTARFEIGSPLPGAHMWQSDEPSTSSAVDRPISIEIDSHRPISERPSRCNLRTNGRSSNSATYSGPLDPQRRLKFSTSGLPQTSSPAPIKRNNGSFDFDSSLSTISNIRSAFYNTDHYESGSSDSECGTLPSVQQCHSAPTGSNLLGNFEENALKGRMKPFGSVQGFSVELAASGAFCAPHVRLPVTTFFFNVADDNAPSPYLGHADLSTIAKRGYHVPKKGIVQATLFNPTGSVVKMFVVRYCLTDMPVNSQTFVRQRTFFMPKTLSAVEARKNKQWLRYLIHLRFATSRSGKLYLHSDIRMLFSRKCELETAVNLQSEQQADQSPSRSMPSDQSATSNVLVEQSAGATDSRQSDGREKIKSDIYELKSFTEMPRDPKYSPRRPTL